MNPNIEVINDKLWGVKFSFIRAGWIQDFPQYTWNIGEQQAALFGDKILLNKDMPPDDYEILKQTFIDEVFSLSRNDLHEAICRLEFLRVKPGASKAEKGTYNMLKLEQLRRYNTSIKG